MPSRLGVVETVYHSQGGGSPVSLIHRHTRHLKGDGPPTVRRILVGPDPVPVGEGRCSLLKIINEEGTFTGGQPTPEERSRVEGLLVVVSFDRERPPRIFVRPGEDCRFQPTDLADVLVRCPTGRARITVLILPE
jgi:hypothetical protein